MPRPLTWSHEARVAAPPDAVYAWLTDYTEQDHSRPGFLRGAGAKHDHGARRRILARDAEGLTVEDRWKGRTFTSRVRPDEAARTVTIEGEYGYHAVWRVSPDGGGARVQVEGRMAPSGVFGLLLPLFAGRMRAETTQDFRGHVADMEEELTAGATATAPVGR